MKDLDSFVILWRAQWFYAILREVEGLHLQSFEGLQTQSFKVEGLYLQSFKVLKDCVQNPSKGWRIAILFQSFEGLKDFIYDPSTLRNVMNVILEGWRITFKMLQMVVRLHLQSFEGLEDCMWSLEGLKDCMWDYV